MKPSNDMTTWMKTITTISPLLRERTTPVLILTTRLEPAVDRRAVVQHVSAPKKGACTVAQYRHDRECHRLSLQPRPHIPLRGPATCLWHGIADSPGMPNGIPGLSMRPGRPIRSSKADADSEDVGRIAGHAFAAADVQGAARHPLGQASL